MYITEVWDKIDRLLNDIAIFHNFYTTSAANPGFFLEGAVLLRNGETDWWRKQILKAHTKKKAFDEAMT